MTKRRDVADLRAWERQPDEPPSLYEILEVYLGLPKRSFRAAVQEHARRHGRPIPRLAPGHVLRAATVWSWARRADAFDQERAESERVAFESARRATRAKRLARLRLLAAGVERALPALVLEEPRDILKALELVASEERLEHLDSPDDRRERPESSPALPDLDALLKPAARPHERTDP